MSENKTNKQRNKKKNTSKFSGDGSKGIQQIKKNL